MGTRNLTCVFSGGQCKIAQYGQFDGYPAGQGKTVFDFIKNCDFDKYREVLKNVKFISGEEVEKLEKLAGRKFEEKHPELCRDAAAEILELTYSGKASNLVDSLDFADDSLFCEWTYLLDLDKNVLEVYKGFNKTKLTARNLYLSG